jgi:hypothetical protein
MNLSDEDSLVVVESKYPARCSCSVEIATDPGRVEEACLAWAEDLRWYLVKNAECPLTFRLYGNHHASEWLGFSVPAWREHHGLTIEIDVTLQNRNAAVSFVAYWDSWEGLPIPRLSQVKRALLTFVHGVCSEFGQRGIAVTPHQFSRQVQDRARLRRLAKSRWVSELVLITLFVLCIPAMVCVGMWKSDLFMVPFGGLWVFGGLLFVMDYLRRRVAGIRGLWSLLAAGLLVFLGVLFVLLGIFPPTD